MTSNCVLIQHTRVVLSRIVACCPAPYRRAGVFAHREFRQDVKSLPPYLGGEGEDVCPTHAVEPGVSDGLDMTTGGLAHFSVSPKDEEDE